MKKIFLLAMLFVSNTHALNVNLFNHTPEEISVSCLFTPRVIEAYIPSQHTVMLKHCRVFLGHSFGIFVNKGQVASTSDTCPAVDKAGKELHTIDYMYEGSKKLVLTGCRYENNGQVIKRRKEKEET